MKTFNHFLTLCGFGLLLLPALSQAQSITIESVSGAHFCAGDPISVTFTAAGTWGHKNAFTLELSDTAGSFDDHFSNLGSILDTAGGTFTFSSTIPGVGASTRYRLRVIGAVPYIVSADNGADLTMGTSIRPGFISVNPPPAQVGVPVKFSIGFYGVQTNEQDTAFWDFGDGADPATVVTVATSIQRQSVTYSTGGIKTFTIRTVNSVGCLDTVKYSMNVFDCSPKIIPHSAKVIQSDTTDWSDNSVIWVNPGVNVQLEGMFDTVFAESGSVVRGCSHCVLYLKTGSTHIFPGNDNVEIYANGANHTDPPYTFLVNCSSLDFDYTLAPPNKAFLDVNDDVPDLPITLFPNPTKEKIFVYGIPENTTNIRVLDLLGKTVIEIPKQHSSSFTLDLSKLQTGTYYIRIVTSGGVTTKKIVKE